MKRKIRILAAVLCAFVACGTLVACSNSIVSIFDENLLSQSPYNTVTEITTLDEGTTYDWGGSSEYIVGTKMLSNDQCRYSLYSLDKFEELEYFVGENCPYAVVGGINVALAVKEEQGKAVLYYDGAVKEFAIATPERVSVSQNEKFVRINSTIITRVKGKIIFVEDVYDTKDITRYDIGENGLFYDVLTQKEIIAFDKEFNIKQYITIPEYATDSKFFVLGNGNMLIQYSYAVEESEANFSYYGSTIDNKYKMVTLLYDAENGKLFEIGCGYFIENVSSFPLEGGEGGIIKDRVNVGNAYKIIDKRLVKTAARQVTLKVEDNGGIREFDKIVDVQKSASVLPLAKDRYIIELVDETEALVNGGGQIFVRTGEVQACNNKYVVANGKVYDLNGKVIVDLLAGGYQVQTTFHDTLVLVKEEGEIEKYYLLKDGTLTQIAQHKVGALDYPDQTYQTISDKIYVVRDVLEDKDVYKIYNTRGELLYEKTYDRGWHSESLNPYPDRLVGVSLRERDGFTVIELIEETFNQEQSAYQRQTTYYKVSYEKK